MLYKIIRKYWNFQEVLWIGYMFEEVTLNSYRFEFELQEKTAFLCLKKINVILLLIKFGKIQKLSEG